MLYRTATFAGYLQRENLADQAQERAWMTARHIDEIRNAADLIERLDDHFADRRIALVQRAFRTPRARTRTAARV